MTCACLLEVLYALVPQQILVHIDFESSLCAPHLTSVLFTGTGDCTADTMAIGRRIPP
jgi:hypothetical protein